MGVKAFENPIVQLIWQMFPGMLLWHIWKERNSRIFRGEAVEWQKVWSKLVLNIKETVRSRQWDEGARRFTAEEKRIVAGWELEESDLANIRFRPKVCHPISPNQWQAPAQNSFKINFDGASRGNPGLAGFGGLCRNERGEIVKVFFGQVGFDSNNSAELEGLTQGLTLAISEGWLPAVVEGDSKVIIGIAKKLAAGQVPGKVTRSWRMRKRIEDLQVALAYSPAVSFQHVRREANKVADLLANQGVESSSLLRVGGLEEFGQDAWWARCQELVRNDRRVAGLMDEDEEAGRPRAQMHVGNASGCTRS